MKITYEKRRFIIYCIAVVAIMLCGYMIGRI